MRQYLFFEKIIQKSLPSRSGLIWYTLKERKAEHFRNDVNYWRFYQGFWDELSLHMDLQNYWFYNNWRSFFSAVCLRSYINIKMALIRFSLVQKTKNNFYIFSNNLGYSYSDVFLHNEHTPFAKFNLYFFQVEAAINLALTSFFFFIFFYFSYVYVFYITSIFFLNLFFSLILSIILALHVSFGLRRLALDYISEDRFRLFFILSFSFSSFIWLFVYSKLVFINFFYFHTISLALNLSFFRLYKCGN